MSRLTSHIAAMLMALVNATVHEVTYVQSPGGDFDSVLPQNTPGQPQWVRIEPFKLRSTPVIISEFQAFVQRHGAWQRGHVPQVFVDRAYLADWADTTHADAQTSPQASATGMSWLVVHVYCESEGAQLPTQLEQESTVAADATHTDVRDDPQWAQHILGWYERPAIRVLSPVGGPADVHDVHGVCGLIWEWVDSFNALFIAGDSRTQGDPDKQKFCGVSAISIVRCDSYVVLMRVALLSSLEGADATGSLGFHCARSLSGDHP